MKITDDEFIFLPSEILFVLFVLLQWRGWGNAYLLEYFIVINAFITYFYHIHDGKLKNISFNIFKEMGLFALSLLMSFVFIVGIALPHILFYWIPVFWDWFSPAIKKVVEFFFAIDPTIEKPQKATREVNKSLYRKIPNRESPPKNIGRIMCPFCKTHLILPEKSEGKHAQCQNCKNRFCIPDKFPHPLVQAKRSKREKPK
jgi:uncharacterized protein YbaR (Trm112 family)